MSPDRLVYMTNQIGQFFAYRRKDEVVPGVANHIKKFWDPRMRSAMRRTGSAQGVELPGTQNLAPAALTA